MTSFTAQAEHPSLTAAKRRLETLERRTPPGYPLGYSLHILKWTCLGCGSQGSHDTLWTIHRAGSSGKAYHVAYRGERIYDLPVEFVNKSETTMRCSACIHILAREPVPALPSYHERLKPRLLAAPTAAKATNVEIDLQALGLLDD